MEKEILSIVIPAYNEENTLDKIIQKTLLVKFPEEYNLEIIIVNDASEDNTPVIAKKNSSRHKNIRYYENRNNLGKSQTVKKGILKTKGSIVVVQDADLEYEPRELTRLLRHYIDNKLDVVYGNRFGQKNKVIYLQNYIGNRFLSLVSNLFTYPRIGRWLPDMEVCYKMVRGDAMREIAENLQSTSGFGLEPEITAKLSRYRMNNMHLRFGVVPISYKARTIEDGKKMHAFKDGIKAIKEILVFNTRS